MDKIAGTRLMFFRHVIKVCAILLCVFFFLLPLIQYTVSGHSNLNASGWEFATGTGDLNQVVEARPVVFFLLIIPAALLILAFSNKSFGILFSLSIASLVAKIAFIMAAHTRVNEMEGPFKLTGFNWFVATLYLGLCVSTFYFAKLERSSWRSCST